MRTVVLFFTLLLWPPAYADTLDEHLAKMKSVLEKDGRCEFAVVAYFTKKELLDEHFFPKEAACVGDIVFDKGTMKERSGCAAFYLNAFTLEARPLARGFNYNAEGKKCGAGGFEAVMTDLLPNNRPVESVFFYASGSKAADQDMGSVKVLIDGQPKYRQWFDKERSNFEANVAARERVEKAKDDQKYRLSQAAERKRQAIEEQKEKKAQAKEAAEQKKREQLWE